MNAVASDNSESLLREVGTLIHVVFSSPHSHWGIFRFKREDGTNFEATGEFGKSVLFEDFILYGTRVPDVEGGDLQVQKFTSTPPKSLKSLSGYLTELTGTPRSSTAKLVQHFGEQTIEILEQSPDLIGDANIPERDIEKLVDGWRTLRSERLALAKIEVKGIPLHKLSKLERFFGQGVDLNQAIKADPFALYTFFEDLPFQLAMAIASQLGVLNTSESAIRGAVIAALRREAWQGHSVIEGAQLGQLVVKALRVSPDAVRPLLAPAVAELRRLGLITVDGRRVQLKTLHDAEKCLFEKMSDWSSRKESELDLDLVPSELMGLKMLRPMGLKQGATKQLLNGLSALLAECCAIAQCQTFEDQLFVAKAIHSIAQAYDAKAIYTTYTPEMLSELRAALGPKATVVGHAELLCLDTKTGIPHYRETNPVETELIVVVGADAYGVVEALTLIDAVPATSRLYLLGCPSDLPSFSVGQPFADLLEAQFLKAFQTRFWGIPEAGKHAAQEEIWTDSLVATPEDFDPSKPISWLACSDEQLEQVIPQIVRELSNMLSLNPVHDIRIVATNMTLPVVRSVLEAITAEFAEPGLPVSFQGRSYAEGVPVVIRQQLEDSNCPPFSVYTPRNVSIGSITFESLNGGTSIIGIDDRIDVFDGIVMTPRFVRGRRYEVVVLLAPSSLSKQIDQATISGLSNSAKRTLIVAGDVASVTDDISTRATSRTRSKLLDWKLDYGHPLSS